MLCTQLVLLRASLTRVVGRYSRFLGGGPLPAVGDAFHLLVFLRAPLARAVSRFPICLYCGPHASCCGCFALNGVLLRTPLTRTGRFPAVSAVGTMPRAVGDAFHSIGLT